MLSYSTRDDATDKWGGGGGEINFTPGMLRAFLIFFMLIV